MRSNESITYRTYEPGDETQIADLFNRAFQMNGAGFVRTPKSWVWRYVQEPGFLPEGVRLAEVGGKIVGSVVGSVTHAYFFGRRYSIGSINDVATHPSFVGRGIARELLQQALDFLAKRGVEVESLDADPNGHARAKLYLPAGFYDYVQTRTIVHVVKSRQLVRNNPLFLAAFPLTYLLAHGWSFAYPRTCSGNFESAIYQNKRFPAFRDAFNRIVPIIYDGYRTYSPERWAWAREEVPSPRYRPSFAVVKEGKKIVAGTSLIKLNLYAFKYGFKVALGLIQDLFIDIHAARSPAELEEIFDLLLQATHKVAAERNCGIIISQLSSTDKLVQLACKRQGWLVIPLGGTHMIKLGQETALFPPPKKSVYLFPENSISGYP